MRILGTEMTTHRHPAAKMPLYPHQCALLDAWNERDAFVLVTKTGSGKTAASVLPVVHNRESAVFVYPTNALIADQERSILTLLEREGISVRVLSPETMNEKYGSEDYHLIRVDASRLEQFRLSMRVKDKGTALLRLMQPSRPRLLLINPDLLYLIFSLKYGRASAEIMSHIRAYPTVVFDEFHLYWGLELAHALFLIHLIREFGGFGRVVLLSATPAPEVLELLNRLLGWPLVLTSDVTTSHSIVEKARPTSFTLEFECRNAGLDEVEAFFTFLQERKDELDAARKARSESNYVPALAILNSVVSAIRLEDLLVEAGWARKKIGVVRGLMSKEERQVDDKVLVIGTSAIEAGIDFKTDLLLFQAGDASSFMQRIGRVGRHGSGKVILFGDSREQAAFSALPGEISRVTLEETVNHVYSERDAFGWFPGTFSGALTMIAQAESIRRRVEEDERGDESAKAEINAWLDGAIDRFSSKMGWEKQVGQAKKRVALARRGESVGKWIKEYIEETSFRSSVPTVRVYDWAEVGRERSPEYEADLVTLLKWGKNTPKYKGKTDTIYIDGFQAGKPHTLCLSESFEDEELGVMRTTIEHPSLKVLQDQHLTSISHLYTMRPHIFVLVSLDFARRLDWRLPWFRCGSRGLKAAIFDGAALVVWEMWKRHQNKSSIF